MSSPGASGRPAIVVTGGSRGIGRAVVLAAVQRGYDVAFTFRTGQADAEETTAAAALFEGDVLAVQADVSDRRQVAEAFARAQARFGRLDGLVNNAGIIGSQRSILDVDAAELTHVFAVNVLGVFYSTAEAAMRMSLKRGGAGGAIVNVSSAAARHGGLPKEAHYAASKGALDSMTLALAKELPEHGVRINAIRPGLIRTEIHDAHGGQAAVEALAPSIPLGRAGEPNEVAGVVLFLLGAESSYVNGAVIDVAGGR